MAEYLAENARLRQLSRRHSEGEISAEEYRQARREILEALEAGRAAAADAGEAPAPEAPAPAFAPDATDMRSAEDAAVFLKTMPPHVPVADAATADSTGWDGHTRILAVVLGISLLLAVSALVYVFAL